ncbi:hypothetical protein CapIbe_008086 [Capra ibex]
MGGRKGRLLLFSSFLSPSLYAHPPSPVGNHAEKFSGAWWPCDVSLGASLSSVQVGGKILILPQGRGVYCSDEFAQTNSSRPRLVGASESKDMPGPLTTGLIDLMKPADSGADCWG